MKKILMALLVPILALSVTISEISSVQAQDNPVPPLSPDESWQPPDEAGQSIEPPVQVETYSQTSSNLQISPPLSIEPGIPSSIVNAYLVNSYGQILTNLYRNEACYLVVSFNGPGFVNHLNLPAVVKFHVQDSGLGDTAKGLYTGQLRGGVLPLLDWTTEFAEARAYETA